MAGKWPPSSNSDQCSAIVRWGSITRRRIRVGVEDRHALRRVRRRHPTFLGMGGLVQEAGRGRAGAREPVDADVREQLVAVDGIFGQGGRWMGPFLELLDDPSELANR